MSRLWRSMRRRSAEAIARTLLSTLAETAGRRLVRQIARRGAICAEQAQSRGSRLLLLRF
eukprot:6186658-Pleurochrysis_carterae.AAC.2